MKIAVVIFEGPYNHQASDSAYNFIQAALEKAHEIRQVFLYHDGVYNINKLMQAPSDDRQISKRWSELGKKGIEIIACVTAAKRRGVDSEFIVAGTQVAGLGQLVEAAADCDRLIVFGD